LTYAEREEKAREKYPDFQDVVFADNLQITQAMYDTIVAAENGPDVVYHLGKNPDEAARIAKLPPLAQARELGRIEASLAAKEPEGKKVSSAPAPITPVGGRAPTPKYDTTDPRSMETMSTSDWIKAENERRSKQNRR
jgi:hypothetical protein